MNIITKLNQLTREFKSYIIPQDDEPKALLYDKAFTQEAEFIIQYLKTHINTKINETSHINLTSTIEIPLKTENSRFVLLYYLTRKEGFMFSLLIENFDPEFVEKILGIKPQTQYYYIDLEYDKDEDGSLKRFKLLIKEYQPTILPQITQTLKRFNLEAKMKEKYTHYFFITKNIMEFYTDNPKIDNLEKLIPKGLKTLHKTLIKEWNNKGEPLTREELIELLKKCRAKICRELLENVNSE